MPLWGEKEKLKADCNAQGHDVKTIVTNVAERNMQNRSTSWSCLSVSQMFNHFRMVVLLRPNTFIEIKICKNNEKLIYITVSTSTL